MTATELADWADDKFAAAVDGEPHGKIARCIAELRRIPTLEAELEDAKRRAVTDEEICYLNDAERLLLVGMELDVLTSRRIVVMSRRLAPQPSVEWREAVPGVHVAELDGWSLCVRRDVVNPLRWHAVAFTDVTAKSFGSHATIDAAKSAAVAWVRKNGGR